MYLFDTFSMVTLKSQINKYLNFSEHKIFVYRNFMLHFVIISHHNISIQCFSGQQKDAEKFCVRSFYSFSALTLFCTTVFSCGIFWKYQGGQGVDKLVGLFYIPKLDFVLDHSVI